MSQRATANEEKQPTSFFATLEHFPVFRGSGRATASGFLTHLGDGQDGHGQDKGNGPGDHVEVGGPAGQRLLRGPQGFEGRVPGVGQHDEPDHARHQGVVHDDEDGDARQRLRRPAEERAKHRSDFFLERRFLVRERSASWKSRRRSRTTAPRVAWCCRSCTRSRRVLRPGIGPASLCCPRRNRR